MPVTRWPLPDFCMKKLRMSSFVFPFVSGVRKMTKRAPKRHTAPNMKYPPEGLMASLMLTGNLVTRKAQSQLNLKMIQIVRSIWWLWNFETFLQSDQWGSFVLGLLWKHFRIDCPWQRSETNWKGSNVHDQTYQRKCSNVLDCLWINARVIFAWLAD